MSSRRPPRYVPTLTEVVPPPAGAAPAAEAAGPAQEELVRRVLEHLDAVLERRLRERIEALVIEQARALAPMLQGEIEAAVRQAVADAFEQESGRPPGRT